MSVNSDLILIFLFLIRIIVLTILRFCLQYFPGIKLFEEIMTDGLWPGNATD